jgi:hypothetical protein
MPRSLFPKYKYSIFSFKQLEKPLAKILEDRITGPNLYQFSANYNLEVSTVSL